MAAPGKQTPKKFSARSVLEVFVGIALYLMVLFVFINAVLRYVFNSGGSLSEELSRWLFVWVTFLGAIVAYADDGHIGVDLVVSKLKGPAKLVYSMIGQLMAFAALAFGLAGAWKYFPMSVPAPASRLPQGILTVSLLIAMVSMLVLSGMKMIRTVKEFKNREEEAKK